MAEKDPTEKEMRQMRTCIVTTRSQTYAIKGQKVLSAHGIGARIVRLNAKTNAKGCYFGIEISCSSADAAADVLRREGVPYSGIAERSEVL